MGAKVISLNTRLEGAWADYLAAKQRAEASNAIADGIDAGRAWRRWLDLFMTPEQRQAIDGNAVIGFGR